MNFLTKITNFKRIFLINNKHWKRLFLTKNDTKKDIIVKINTIFHISLKKHDDDFADALAMYYTFQLNEKEFIKDLYFSDI